MLLAPWREGVFLGVQAYHFPFVAKIPSIAVVDLMPFVPMIPGVRSICTRGLEEAGGELPLMSPATMALGHM